MYIFWKWILNILFYIYWVNNNTIQHSSVRMGLTLRQPFYTVLEEGRNNGMSKDLMFENVMVKCKCIIVFDLYLFILTAMDIKKCTKLRIPSILKYMIFYMLCVSLGILILKCFSQHKAGCQSIQIKDI